MSMTMSLSQQIITITMVVLGTFATRGIVFLVFQSGKPTPPYVRYLGVVLPSAILGLLVIYCFRDIQLTSGSHGLPEALATMAVIMIHLWKRKMLVSMTAGTFLYMFLVQYIF